MAITFESFLKQAEGVNATGIPVPADVVAQLGAKNAKVTASVRKAGSDGEWFSYPIAIGSRGGEHLLSFSGAFRKETGLVAGDPLEVSIEPVASA